MNKTKLYIGIGLGVLALIILLVVLLSQIKPGSSTTANTSPTPAPSPTFVPYDKNNLKPVNGQPSIFQQSKEYQDIQNSIKLTEAPEVQQAKKSGALLDVIPYKGKLFVFDYDYDKFAYRVTFNSSQVLEANKEFDDWLKKQGITSRATLYNLQIQYKNL